MAIVVTAKNGRFNWQIFFPSDFYWGIPQKNKATIIVKDFFPKLKKERLFIDKIKIFWVF